MCASPPVATHTLFGPFLQTPSRLFRSSHSPHFPMEALNNFACSAFLLATGAAVGAAWMANLVSSETYAVCDEDKRKYNVSLDALERALSADAKYPARFVAHTKECTQQIKRIPDLNREVTFTCTTQWPVQPLASLPLLELWPIRSVVTVEGTAGSIPKVVSHTSSSVEILFFSRPWDVATRRSELYQELFKKAGWRPDA